MTSPTSQLGGGYTESNPDPGPTVEAVLAAATAGAPSSHLVILAGPPGVGKSTVSSGLLELLPGTFCVDKDVTASGFILEAAASAGLPSSEAYGTKRYWRELRPREYAGAVGLACANLVGTRIVLAVGGWGPELGVERLWIGLEERVAPARLTVTHLDPPELERWRQRMAARGSRTDSPWFEHFCEAVTAAAVWSGAVHVPTGGPLNQVVEDVLAVLTPIGATT